MESPNARELAERAYLEPVTEPDWVGAVLDPTNRINVPETDQNGPTVRAEFVRRIGRSDLGADRETVLRAGLMALDGRLRTRSLDGQPGSRSPDGQPGSRSLDDRPGSR